VTICDWEPYVQGSSAGSDAWPVSYETVGSSSSTVERRAPSTSKLSLIRSLCEQLKSTQQELKTVTAKVDVALSKASRATDVEKFILEEIENLGKAMKCKFFGVLVYSFPDGQCVIFLTHANSIADNFWADRSKAMKLTILQDQIAQAGVLAETSCACTCA
jgi:hypothetical protein